jgi:predicted DNA-binding protein YlxM (UPF0122 family)
MSFAGFEKMAEANPDKYPSRMGKAWDDNENKKLLQSIQKGISIEDIAKDHSRTVGGINGRLKHLAFEYYNKDYEIEDIQELTGLSEDEIADAIARGTSKLNKTNKPSKVVKTNKRSDVDKSTQIINVLNDMKSSIDTLIKLLETR